MVEDGAPDVYGLPAAISTRPHELTIFAFDLLHRDGVDLRPLSLSQRKDLLTRLVRRSKVNCLHLIASFSDGSQLLATAERMRLEGIVSKRRPTTQVSAGIGARSRQSLGATQTGNGGGCLSGIDWPRILELMEMPIF
jgi:ATP dependent DNA ligase domain